MKEKIVLERVPPGDNWKQIDGETMFNNLTSALAFAAKKTGIKEFHVSAKQGKVWVISDEPDIPQEVDDLYGD